MNNVLKIKKTLHVQYKAYSYKNGVGTHYSGINVIDCNYYSCNHAY